VDSTGLVTLFRKDMSDEASPPFLWSDEELFGYADDAQKMFARLHRRHGRRPPAR
jgi:hypothetical protein